MKLLASILPVLLASTANAELVTSQKLYVVQTHAHSQVCVEQICDMVKMQGGHHCERLNERVLLIQIQPQTVREFIYLPCALIVVENTGDVVLPHPRLGRSN